MKQLPATTLILIAFFGIFSCKKEHLVPQEMFRQPVVYDNYTNLKVGNYWIYELFTIDSTGYGVSAGSYDSCYVEKDTTLHGNTYHKYVQISPGGYPQHAVYFLRDSLSYTIDAAGYILFSSTDFTNEFYLHYAVTPPPASDTIYKRSSRMINETMPVTTPAGTFSVLNFRTTYIMYPPYSSAGYRRELNARYCKEVGLVSQVQPFFAAIPTMKERRLLRYHLE